MLPTKIIFLLTRITFKTFQAKRKKMLHYAFGHAFGLVILCFVMLLLTQSTPNTRILGSTTHSPRFYNYSLHQQFVKEFINILGHLEAHCSLSLVFALQNSLQLQRLSVIPCPSKTPTTLINNKFQVLSLKKKKKLWLW